MVHFKVLKVYFNILVIISLIVLNSCKDSTDGQNSDVTTLDKTPLQLKEKEAVTFSIDDETNYNVNVKLNTIKDQTYLSFFNANNFSIYIYNYDNKSLFKRIQLDKDGPNGIKLGGQLQPQYFIHTLDSIFLTGSINHYLVDGSGKIIVEGRISNNKSGIASSDSKQLSFDKASYFKNGNVYSGITSYSNNNESINLRAVVPIPFDSVSSTYLKKDILIHDNDEISKIKTELLKEGMLAVMGLSFEKNSDYLYASTPISDTVYVFENDKLIRKIFTGTDKIEMSDSRAYFDQFRTKTYLKALEYPFYKGLFYDSSDNRNFLYRLVSKGNRIVYNEKTKENEQQSKGAYLIAIDLKNNEIKYLDLKTDGINLNSCFVTKGKIHFKLKVQDNENEMIFKTFSIE